MREITRSFDIDAGHRLLKHESKCRHLHGHRYTVELTVGATRDGGLDEVGRIIDFGVVKDEFGKWLNDVYDHGFIVQKGDPLIAWLEVNGMKHHVMDNPPSIEHLVKEWFVGASFVLLKHSVRVVKVRGYETATCWAEYDGADE